jgi:hypothetical protein
MPAKLPPDIGDVVNFGEPRGGQVRPMGMLGLALAETLSGLSTRQAMRSGGPDERLRQGLVQRRLIVPPAGLDRIAVKIVVEI